MDYIGKSGYKYVIRVQSNFSKITKDAADIDRQVTTSYKQNQEKRNIKFRVVNIALPCGEIEKIVTNLDEKFEVNDIKCIYKNRWEIEKSFDIKKIKYVWKALQEKQNLLYFKIFIQQYLSKMWLHLRIKNR